MKHNKDFNELYLVETYMMNPKPVGPVGGHQGDEWDILIEKFKNLGIKKILLGGQRFAADRSNSSGKKYHGYCVGDTDAHLRRDFKVTLSLFTAPDRI